MSFSTALTGLHGAQVEIATTSNNIANIGTTGFKRSTTEFGDIFSTSPSQSAKFSIGSGTLLQSIRQEFAQGNIATSGNTLDMAISGQGFFTLKPSLTAAQIIYSRSGSFTINNDMYVVDNQGQYLQVYPVNTDGSVVSTGMSTAKSLQLPTTSGAPQATKNIQLSVNLPASAVPISQTITFDKTNPASFNQSSSVTVYDSLGTPRVATIYYVKTSNASGGSSTNKWQTHLLVGDTELKPPLMQAKNSQGETYYIDKFGAIMTGAQLSSVGLAVPAGSLPLYKKDDQTQTTPSLPASIVGQPVDVSGFDFGTADDKKVTVVTDPALYATTREGGATGSNVFWGVDMFSIKVDGSTPQSVSIKPGSYSGAELAAQLTSAVNSKFDDSRLFTVNDTYLRPSGTVVQGNDIIQVHLLKTDGQSLLSMDHPLEIDLLGSAGSTGTPTALDVQGAISQQPNASVQLTRDELVSIAQKKLNDVLNQRRVEFNKPASWPDPSNPPIVIGYDVVKRALTFKLDGTQLDQYSTVKVFNPTSSTTSLGIPSQLNSPEALIGSVTHWTGSEAIPDASTVDPKNQLRGIVVAYDAQAKQFSFTSGSTGEASAIAVGRSALLGSPQSQVNVYNLKDTDFTVPQTVSFEVDGRVLSYVFTPPSSDPVANESAFFAGIEQAVPVSFQNVTSPQASSNSTTQVASLNPVGKLMNGDTFEVTLTPSYGNQPVTLNVGPLNIDATSSSAARLSVLGDAVQGAIDSYNANPSTIHAITASFQTVDNQLQFSWTTSDAIISPVSMKQTVRGSDDLTLSPMPFTDATVVAGIPDIQAATSSTAAIQTVALTKPTGATPAFSIGDVYRVSIPMVDGSVNSQDITLGAGSLDDLVTQLNAVSVFSSVQFSKGASGTSLMATWKTNSPVTGAIGVEQVKAGGITVRPRDLGPLTLTRDGDNLRISGALTGDPFRLNVRIDGVRVPADPLNSIPGYRIGSAQLPTLTGGNNHLLGIGDNYTPTLINGVGLPSTSATAVGSRAIAPMNLTFVPDVVKSENQLTVSVDGVVSDIVLPIQSYTGDTFAAAIQDRVNQFEDPNTHVKISGVSVKYDAANNRLVFTAGSTGPNSQINVVGPANFGLRNVTQYPGATPTITVLKSSGTVNAISYQTKVPNPNNPAIQDTKTWVPLYLDQGVLSFDNYGKIVSPLEAINYSSEQLVNPGSSVDLGSAATLNLGVDFGKATTQFNSAFGVTALSQDGYASGSMDGLDIDASGTVFASYSNGKTVALGKVMLSTFSNINGLQQVGNADYVATAVSGEAHLGQAGSGGFGTIKSGALEQSNVDVTDELVSLITSQRNFQASAKMIDTQKQLTETLIQIR